MNMNSVISTNRLEPTQRTAAKVAGFSGLFAMAVVVFANYGLLNPLIVPGNAAETARNIVAHETQFHVVITCFLIYSASVVVLLAALYVILKPANRGLALVGALFRLVFALLWLLTTLNMLGALRLLGSATYLQVVRGRPITGLSQVTHRRQSRRLLRGPAIFWNSRDRLQLFVA